MRIDLLTLFPGWFDGPLGESIIQRARDAGVLQIRAHQIRDWAENDRHASVDDTPYGGGGGMLLKATVMARAMDEVFGAPATPDRAHVIHMSPRGTVLTQDLAIELAALPRLGIVCGHYEGLDERIIETRVDREVSLGDFVLTGGEIPAMALVDAVARMLPGSLKNELSADRDSFMDGLLEGPHYTRPAEFEGRRVPEVLLSGNHASVREWREEQALEMTRRRRPDLLRDVLLSPGQVRRLARRARPFAVTMATPDSAGSRVVFLSPELPFGEALTTMLHGRRFEHGLHEWVRIYEFRELFTGDEAAARRALREHIRLRRGAPAASRAEAVLLRNLGRALMELEDAEND